MQGAELSQRGSVANRTALSILNSSYPDSEGFAIPSAGQHPLEEWDIVTLRGQLVEGVH